MTTFQRQRFLSAAATVLSATAFLSAQRVSDTLARYPTGSISFETTEAMGHLITVDGDNPTLVGFTFWIWPRTASQTFDAYVMQWDGAKAYAPGQPPCVNALSGVLYDSGQVTAVGPSEGGYQAIPFDTGGLVLTPGTYVVFLTGLAWGGDPTVQGLIPYVSGVPWLTSGATVFTNARQDSFDALTCQPWNRAVSTEDVRFWAEFGPAQ